MPFLLAETIHAHPVRIIEEDGRGEKTNHTRLAKGLLAIVFAVVVAVPVSALAAPPPKEVDWTAKVVERLDMAYAEEIVDEICAMGDSVLGFRGAGGPADLQAAEYIASEMKAIGLSDVVKEKVPVDSWQFKSAYMDVPGMTRITASSFGGFPGTDDLATKRKHEAITAPIVWCGNGFDSDYDAQDVEGKIVLVNWIGYDFWVDSMAYGAWEHGAAGIVVTTIDSNVGQGPYAISCHDGLYVPGWPPLISISKENGTLIRDRLLAGEQIKVTMYSDIVKGSMLTGSYGYNVVGYLPGKDYGTPEDEFVIIGPHHDAWFDGAMDDTSGVSAMLVIAKAMAEVQKKCGWVPERTIIFTSHTAEEYGIDNTYYDWCWGAYYQINVEHPEWVGKSVAYLALELMGMPGEPVSMNVVPEMYSFVRQVLARNTANTPYGAFVTPKAHTWADHWTFSAAGVPGLEIATSTDAWDTYYYHTQRDAPGIIDYGYMRQLFAVITDMTMQMTQAPIIPYNLQTLATNLNGELRSSDEFAVNGLYDIYADYGLDPAVNLDKTVIEAARFSDLVGMLNPLLSSIDPALAQDANDRLMSLVGTLDRSLIAIGVWEQDWYPYQQPTNDVYHAVAALDLLADSSLPIDDRISDAIWELNWVGIVWYYDYMSYGNYLDQRDRLTGDRVASWGLQTHLQLAVDVWPEYDALSQLAYDEDVAWVDVEPIYESLESKLSGVSLVQLENAFELMWTALTDANSQIEELIAILQ